MVARMKRSLANLLVLLVVVGLFGGNWLVLRDLQDIHSRDPQPTATVPAAESFGSGSEVIRIGVVSRFAPNIIFSGYQPVLDYLNTNSEYRFELRLSTSYQDAVDKLEQGEVTASFLGAWIYGHLESRDLMPLAAPRNAAGSSVFHAVLVTRADSPVATVQDLAGLRVALPSPDSWSGNWLQRRGLPDVGLTTADLDSLHHFDHHQTVVWEVLRGHFDAGVVKESVADRFKREGLRQVALSPPIPGAPLVARRDGPPAVLKTLTRLLLALNDDDPRDREILAGWTPEFAFGFRPVSEADYTEAFGTLEGER